MSSGIKKYNMRAEQTGSLLCLGLDPDFEKLPKRFQDMPRPQFEFNKWIIEQTHEYVAAYKPNIAFYEARGSSGLAELELTMQYLKEKHSDIFTICDAKRNEIGNTMEQYARAIFDRMGFDACTVNPYLGEDALEPFLKREDKVSIVLCRTSNPGAREFQDLLSGGRPLWQIVAERVRDHWNKEGNCMLVIGATYPEEIKAVRAIAPELTFLIPGVGAQGGSVEDAVRAGLNAKGLGMTISTSRVVLFSENPGAEAKKLKEKINFCRT